MTEEKRKWIKEKGYHTITDKVLDELVGRDRKMISDRYAEAKRKQLSQQFQYYNRYGSMITLYSDEYIATRSIEKLNAMHERNVQDFGPAVTEASI